MNRALFHRELEGQWNVCIMQVFFYLGQIKDLFHTSFSNFPYKFLERVGQNSQTIDGGGWRVVGV